VHDGVIAATKLEAPGLRAGLVARDDLLRRLADPSPARLTLVCAPAGSGKTTLVAQWAAWRGERRRFAWLSLDPEDSDRVRLWDGVIAALDRVHPGFGVGALAALHSPRADLLRTVVPLVVNELIDRAGEPVVLVLDDLHVVEDPETLRSLAALIERAPAGLRLAITTRRDPPLALARLRARGQLIEIRSGDLRFTDAEAAAMLAGLGCDVEPDQLAELQARTEGWAAGLQLAGLSLRSHPRSGLGAGDGSAHVADYLGEEVVDAQPPATRAFLLRTSVLERMSGPLCDAVLEATGSAQRLDELADAGLFVVPLDAGRTWFRYHALFRQTLARRLAAEDPAAAVVAHERAAAWLEAHGLYADAIRHALAAGGGGDLVAAHWRTFFNRGELTTVSGWLAALPADAVQRDPRLWLARAWLALDTGRVGDLPALLDAAERGGSAEHRAWAALLRAVHAFKVGDLSAAAAALRRARATPGPADSAGFWTAVSAVLGGAVAYWRGEDAMRELVLALRTARADGNRLAEVYALGYLSLDAGETGDRATAAARLAEAQALLASDPALDEHFVALTVHLAEAAAATTREDALRAAGRALELARRGAGALEEVECLRALATTRARAGDDAGARRALSEAGALAATCPDAGRLAERLAGRRTPPSAGEEGLSRRELDILRLLATDLSQREIGAELYVSMNTVKTHVKNIFFKLRVGSRDQAIDRARELGLL
jgi:LuxR family maltose regulon positive regulatory protein